MAAGTVSFRYVILGLLTLQPMSGYDIKRFLAGLSWLTGSPSGGSLYPVLRALRQEELVTVETVPGLDRPPKKIYSITYRGRQVLRAWTKQPVATCASLKAFLMRLFLADSHSRTRLSAHLQERRDQVASHNELLAGGLETLDAGPNLGQQLAVDYGLALATAELAWLDATLDRLPEQPLPKEDEESDGAALDL
jgi:DNA-binding PadR family transcriptional regulator